eukprot:TRINITY_DN24750_c0_g1_i1.p1 TRINITY_DN24750_c0_g1~~TRINITY_DN24750_c0_g1_i1.p1  ORF type:complete len:184 (+),score=21.41 TRINITY_DN24750_c0_g1_i1:147-698(+)
MGSRRVRAGLSLLNSLTHHEAFAIAASSQTPIPLSSFKTPTPNLFSSSFPSPHSSSPFFNLRTFSSSTTSPSNLVLIKSEEELSNALNKVQDESLPAIFYFTAVWCGPCKFISPIIEELTKKYPHVTTYKIDIDQKGLGCTLTKLRIYSVPTLHFFQNGKKATEMIGADITKLKDTVENLYRD